MNCQCFLALLFFIKLVAAVSGTIVQADDHFENQVYLAAECYNVENAVTTILNYNPSGNMSLVTEDTVWKPPWLNVRT
jgi:hypothetical protein